MRLRILHRTEYHYTAPVTESSNELRLCPLDSRWQKCESQFISVLPAARLSHYLDLHCNTVHHFEVPQSHQRLVIDSRAVVNTQCKIDFDSFPYGFLHASLEKCRKAEACYPYLQDSVHVERTPAIWRQALDIKEDSEDVFQTSYSIMEHIFENYSYVTGETTVSTHASEVIANRKGVCQDFAHAMLAFCRSLEIPARYVSGYFFDATRDQHLRGSEASHAWVEVYIDGHDWIGLDPTNNKVVDDTYVALATGRDYRDVPPVMGTYMGGGRSAMRVTVKVERLDPAKSNGA